MTAIQVNLEDEVLDLLHQTNRPPADAAREMIVSELYRRAALSSGKAAELLGMARAHFIRLAGEAGIAHFDMSDDEWAAERSQSERL